MEYNQNNGHIILPINIEINSRSAGSVAPTDCANRPKIVSAAIFVVVVSTNFLECKKGMKFTEK